ncbi:MAG TPA: DUF3054 family protein [Anaerolineales bacterium]|nr:DUF3054 family protein [Anaerolineales bacterium]
MTSFVLILGDLFSLALVTLIGFASHGEFTAAFVPRMGAAWVPLCIGWFVLAPQLDLFQASITSQAAQLWRPAFVLLFAGPFAAILRGIVLNAPVVPSFAVVLSITGALGVTIWRLIWLFTARRWFR